MLLDLMDELDADVRFKLDLPPVRDPDYDKEITLRHYMARKGLGIATASGLRMLSHSEFVREWANQYGTAHEAWRVTEHFLNAPCTSAGKLPMSQRFDASLTRSFMSLQLPG
jgi:hypothetical protein